MSGRDHEECERQAEQEAWLHDGEELFIQQTAAEAQMQAMLDQGKREASMRPAASEHYVDADVRELDPGYREEAETLKRKRQEDKSCSFSGSASSLMTWAACLLVPTPNPPHRSMLSPVIHKEEEEEYIFDSTLVTGCTVMRGVYLRSRPLTRRLSMKHGPTVVRMRT